MRSIFDIRSVICIVMMMLLCVAVFAQTQPQALLTATGHTLTISDLSPGTQKLIETLPTTIAQTRSGLFDQMVAEELIGIEAKAQNTDVIKLVTSVRTKVPEPTETEINSVYQANLAALDNKPLKDVREQVVNYLKSVAGQKAFEKFVSSLKAKYKIVQGKDVNAPTLSPTDTLVTVNGRAITGREFEDKYKYDLYETKANVSDQVLGELNELIYSTLVIDEARSLGVDSSAVISREITDKMHDYSDRERDALESAFRERLFAKYNVKFLYQEPEPVARTISVGTSPSTGPANAPVTVVMFSDFQCPACSATHPILKTVLAEYPGKVHFVVRDYPLVNRHDHAMRAALAAGAANAQGKFFEYIDVLYTHQDALDDSSLRKYAADMGLNMKQFELDFNSEKIAAEVNKDLADAALYKLPGTPSIFVNGVYVRDLSADGLRKAINRALKK